MAYRPIPNIAAPGGARGATNVRAFVLRAIRCTVMLTLMLPWLSACLEDSSLPPSAVGYNPPGGRAGRASKSSFASDIVGYNHTDKDVGSFSVQIGKSSAWGGFLEAHHGGGKFSCCISVPDPWRPGLTAIVRWTDDYGENEQERTVPIPQYDANQVAQVSVHFLRNGEIKVFIPSAWLGNPNYPLKGPEAGLYPGEDPVEVWRYGRPQKKE